MALRGVRRVIVGIISMFAVMVLGLVIDTAGAELIELNYQHGVDDGPFAPVLSMMDNLVWLVVPLLLFGIVVWMLWSPVREERREEQIRRVGP